MCIVVKNKNAKERTGIMRKEIDSRQGLYRESFEPDNCGIGAIVNIKGV